MGMKLFDVLNEKRRYVSEANAFEGRRWWYNTNTGQVIEVDKAHGDVVLSSPETFGISAREMEKLKAHFSTGGDVSHWEMARYTAQAKGWVRIGAGGEGYDSDEPYLYAASVQMAQKGVAWMVSQGIVVDAVGVEIERPDIPVPGHGWYQNLVGEDIDLFIKYGKPFRRQPVRENMDYNFVVTRKPVTLGDLCDIRVGMEDADFWIVRRGTPQAVGRPTNEYNPEHIGVKVTATDVLVPGYLFYMVQYLHMQGQFEQLARGTLRLVNIRTSDIKNITVRPR
jgi:hypothetical protein